MLNSVTLHLLTSVGSCSPTDDDFHAGFREVSCRVGSPPKNVTDRDQKHTNLPACCKRGYTSGHCGVSGGLKRLKDTSERTLTCIRVTLCVARSPPPRHWSLTPPALCLSRAHTSASVGPWALLQSDSFPRVFHLSQRSRCHYAALASLNILSSFDKKINLA